MSDDEEILEWIDNRADLETVIDRIDRVRDDLFITGYPGALTMEEQPGWHIVTVAEELVDDIRNHSKFPLYFAVPWSDPAETVRSNRTTLEDIRSVYERERFSGNRVLIHCAAGIERAATAVCYILSDGNPEQAAMTQAYHELAKVRPEVMLTSILSLSNRPN